MPEQTLIDLGLSKNEAKIYLNLVELGSSTAGEIAKKSKLHRTNVYDALERLLRKGLISYVVKGAEKKKHYEAAHPENLKELLKIKEQNLNKILPTLVLNKELSKKDAAQIYEGLSGMKVTLKDILQEIEHGKVKEIVVFGCTKDLPIKLKNVLPEYHRKRIAAKINKRHIYDENAKERIKILNDMPYTAAKYMPSEQNSPATTLVYGEKVAFWVQSDSVFVLIVESKKMADAYRKYFEMLWKISV